MNKTVRKKQGSQKKKGLKYSKLFLSVLIIAGIVGLFLVINSKKAKPLGTVSNKTWGKKEAPLHIEIYTDPQCAACAQGEKVLRSYLEQHPEEFFLQYFHYPIESLHPYAMEISIATECAAQQDKFWPMHELVTKYRWNLEHSDDVTSMLRKYAASVGLDGKKYARCIQEDKIHQAVVRDRKRGESVGVNSTPTYFINEEKSVGWKQLQEALQTHFSVSKDPENEQ